MNLFPTDRGAFASAMALDDKRVVRQASEVVVILGSVNALLGIGSPYKATHQPNHKIIKWLLDPVNWGWTYNYALACNLLYRDIYKRECICHEKLRDMRLPHMHHFELDHLTHLAEARPSAFCNAASNKKLGLDFTSMLNTQEAYKAYLRARWERDTRPPTWTGREAPAWR